jgi:hypothetical protein
MSKCAAAAGALLCCLFNMSSEAFGKDFDAAKFSELDATFYNKNDLKGECSPCKNDFGNAESCNPECGADIFSASFSCEPDRRSISLILSSFASKERLKVLEEVLKTNGVILLSGGKSDERSITEITFSVSDYNGTWILSLRGYDFQELLKAKLKDKQRSFTIKIGGLSY